MGKGTRRGSFKKTRRILIAGYLVAVTIYVILGLSQGRSFLKHDVFGVETWLSETWRNRTRTAERNINKTLLLILSYQRSGSTFMGQLFNQNKDAFYWFEPGDAIYSHIYKTKFGWNVPADIFHFWNGTRRSIPRYEINNIVNILSSIFTCSSGNFPTELFIHRFHKSFYRDQRRLTSYTKCVPWTKVDQQLQKCQKIIYDTGKCPEFFKPHLNTTYSCAQNSIQKRTNSSYYDAVNFYDNCIHKTNDYFSKCIWKLTTQCVKANIVALKTVRITMETVQELLKKFPNLYTIHYIRDPRAVVASMHKSFGNFASLYGSKYYVKEAQILCNQILKDVLLSKRLQEKYPSKILTVFYENLALSSSHTLYKIYEFIGRPVPYNIINWLNRYTNLKGPKENWTNRNSSIAATHWMKQLTYEEVIKIDAKCENLYSELEYPWLSYYKSVIN